MANVLVPGNNLRVQIFTFDTTQVGINTFWYTVLGPPAPFPTATDQDVATLFDSTMSSFVKPILNNNAVYRGIRVQICDTVGKPLWVDVISVSSPGAGTGGPTAMAKQVTGITSWYTARPKQAFRGRTYWPFPAAEHDSGDGFPDSAYVTAINNLSGQIFPFSAIAVGGRVATLQFNLFHRKIPGFTPMVSFFARPLWATQRRRGSYGRPQGAPPF